MFGNQEFDSIEELTVIDDASCAGSCLALIAMVLAVLAICLHLAKGASDTKVPNSDAVTESP